MDDIISGYLIHAGEDFSLGYAGAVYEDVYFGAVVWFLDRGPG